MSTQNSNNPTILEQIDSMKKLLKEMEESYAKNTAPAKPREVWIGSDGPGLAGLLGGYTFTKGLCAVSRRATPKLFREVV